MAELALCDLWRSATFEEQRCVCVPKSVEPGALDLQGIEQRPELILDDLLRSVRAAIARQIATGAGARLGFIVLILVRGPVLKSPALLHPSGQFSDAPPPNLRKKRLHQSYGGYQREFPPYTKRHSRKENLTGNLCDLPFSFQDRATRRLPPAVSWGPTFASPV